MIEFPSIANSSKAPRKRCIGFEKIDGSNFRAKWTQKHGFNLYGTRTQLIDENTEMWGEMVTVFKNNYEKTFDRYFRGHKEYRNEREIIVFGEFFGKNSFAGRHEDEDHDIVFFDVLVGHKNRKFVKPTDFIQEFQEIVPIPNVEYVGNLNEEFIEKIRNTKFGNSINYEGVICKGTETRGDYVGGVWTCKIKTIEYMEKLKKLRAADWEKHWE